MLLRAISAILGISLLTGVGYWGGVHGIVFICSLVTLLGCLEFSQMVVPGHRLFQSLFVCFSFAFYLLFTFLSQSILYFVCAFILIVSYFILASQQSLSSRMNQLALWTVGLLYCGILPGIVAIGSLKSGFFYFIALLLVSFGTDTFAYLGGRLLGRRALAPLISPQKTLEGSLIGLLGGSLLATLFVYWMAPTTQPIFLIYAAFLIASLASQVGDLFESMLKRHCGIKDSGKIMPGHGGILDRIDGLLFAAPVVFLALGLNL